MAAISGESQFFPSNIINMIPESPLNKMVPLMEDQGGGGGGLILWNIDWCATSSD